MSVAGSTASVGVFGTAMGRLFVMCGTESGLEWMTGPGARVLTRMKDVLMRTASLPDRGMEMWTTFLSGVSNARLEKASELSDTEELEYLSDISDTRLKRKKRFLAIEELERIANIYEDKTMRRWCQIARLELAMFEARAPVDAAGATPDESKTARSDASSDEPGVTQSGALLDKSSRQHKQDATVYIDLRSWLKEQRWLPPDVWDMIAVVALDPDKLEIYRDGIIPWLFDQKTADGRVFVPLRFSDRHATDRLPKVYPLAVVPADVALPSSSKNAREFMFRYALKFVDRGMLFEPDATLQPSKRWRNALTDMRRNAREIGTAKGTDLQRWISPTEDVDGTWLPYAMANDVRLLCQGCPTKEALRHRKTDPDVVQWLARRMDPWFIPVVQTNTVVADVIRIVRRHIRRRNRSDDAEDEPDAYEIQREARQMKAKEELSAVLHRVARRAFFHWYSPTRGGIDSGSTMSELLAQQIIDIARAIVDGLAHRVEATITMKLIGMALDEQTLRPAFPLTMCVGEDAHLQWYENRLKRIPPELLAVHGSASAEVETARERIVGALVEHGKHESRERVGMFFDAHIAPALRQFTALRQRLKLEPVWVKSSDGTEHVSAVCVEAILNAIAEATGPRDLCDISASGEWWQPVLVASQMHSPFAHRDAKEVKRSLQAHLKWLVGDEEMGMSDVEIDDKLVEELMMQLTRYSQSRVDAGLEGRMQPGYLSGMVVLVLDHAFATTSHYNDVTDAIEYLSINNYSLHSLLESKDPYAVDQAFLEKWSKSRWSRSTASAFLRPWSECCQDGRRRVVCATRRGAVGDVDGNVWPTRVFLDAEPASDLAKIVKGVADHMFTAFWANMDRWVAMRSRTAPVTTAPGTTVTGVAQPTARELAIERLRVLLDHTNPGMSLTDSAVIGDPAPFARLCINATRHSHYESESQAAAVLRLLQDTTAQLVAVSNDVFMQFVVDESTVTGASPLELLENPVYKRLGQWFRQGYTLMQVAVFIEALLRVISSRPFSNVRVRNKSLPTIEDLFLSSDSNPEHMRSVPYVHDQREGLPFATEVLTCTLALAYRWNMFPSKSREVRKQQKVIINDILSQSEDAAASSHAWLTAVHRRAQFWEAATKALQTVQGGPPDLGEWTNALSVNQHAKLVFLYDTALVHYMDLHARQCSGASAYDVSLFCNWYAEILRIQRVLEIPDTKKDDDLEVLHPEAAGAVRDITDQLWAQNRIRRCMSHTIVERDAELRRKIMARTAEDITHARLDLSENEWMWNVLVKACNAIARPMLQQHSYGEVRIAVAHQATALYNQLQLGWNALEVAYRSINSGPTTKRKFPQEVVRQLVVTALADWQRLLVALKTPAKPTAKNGAGAASVEVADPARGAGRGARSTAVVLEYAIQMAADTGLDAMISAWRATGHTELTMAVDMESGARMAFLINTILTRVMQRSFKLDLDAEPGIAKDATVETSLPAWHLRSVETLQKLCVVIMDTVDALLSFGDAVLRSSRGVFPGLLSYNHLARIVSKALADWIKTWDDGHPLQPLAGWLTWDGNNTGAMVATKPESTLRMLRVLVDDARRGEWTPSPTLYLWMGLDVRSGTRTWTPNEKELAALGAVDAALLQLQVAIDRQRTLQDTSVPAVAAVMGEPLNMDRWSELKRHVDLLSKELHKAVQRKVLNTAVRAVSGVDNGLVQLVLTKLWPLKPMENEEAKSAIPMDASQASAAAGQDAAPPSPGTGNGTVPRAPAAQTNGMRSTRSKRPLDPIEERRRNARKVLSQTAANSARTNPAPVDPSPVIIPAAAPPVAAIVEAPPVAAAAAAAPPPVAAAPPPVAAAEVPHARRHIRLVKVPPTPPPPRKDTAGASQLRPSRQTGMRFVQIPSRYRPP